MAKRKKQRGRSSRKDSLPEKTPSGPKDLVGGLPLWLPAVLFVGLTLALFRSFVFSDRMLFGGDTLALGYVARAFYAQALTGLHEFPRWAPELLGGTPFLEALSAPAGGAVRAR